MAGDRVGDSRGLSVEAGQTSLTVVTLRVVLTVTQTTHVIAEATRFVCVFVAVTAHTAYNTRHHLVRIVLVHMRANLLGK